MEVFFAKAGVVSIACLILIIIKKIYDYFYNKRSDGFGGNSIYIADEKVFNAAGAFAKGATNEEIKELLLNCIDFDEEDAEDILSLSEKYKTKDDGGYNSFIKAVNTILGDEVYYTVKS